MGVPEDEDVVGVQYHVVVSHKEVELSQKFAFFHEICSSENRYSHGYGKDYGANVGHCCTRKPKFDKFEVEDPKTQVVKEAIQEKV